MKLIPALALGLALALPAQANEFAQAPVTVHNWPDLEVPDDGPSFQEVVTFMAEITHEDLKVWDDGEYTLNAITFRGCAIRMERVSYCPDHTPSTSMFAELDLSQALPGSAVLTGEGNIAAQQVDGSPVVLWHRFHRPFVGSCDKPQRDQKPKKWNKFLFFSGVARAPQPDNLDQLVRATNRLIELCNTNYQSPRKLFD